MTTLAAPPEQAPPEEPVARPAGLRPPLTYRRVALWLIALGSVLLSVWAMRRIDLLSLRESFENLEATQRLFGRMWPPVIEAADRGRIIEAVLDTFFMAFAGTTIGVVLAVPLAFLAARNVMPWLPVRVLARAIIVFTRAVPSIAFALVFVRVYSIGVLPGILAIGIHSIGMIGKLLADAIEEIEPGPREGVTATGAGAFQDLATGVWTQITPSLIAISLYRLEIDFRSAPILGFVGAGGIGVVMRGFEGNLRYPDLLGVAILMVVLVIAMEALSALTRRAILGAEGATALGKAKDTAPTVTETDSTVVAGPTRLTPPWTQSRVRLHLASALGFVLLVLSFWIPDISFRDLFVKSRELPTIAWRLIPKDLAWFTDRVWSPSEGIQAVGEALIETVAIGVSATFLSLILAVPLGFLAASNTAPGRIVYVGARLIALLLRAAPDIVIAVLLVVILGPFPATGAIALTIGLVGFATKLFADNIEEVRQGPRDGVVATGASRFQDVGTGVIPQVMPALVGNMLYLLDISLRSSTILGIVGAGGIGFLLSNAAANVGYQELGGIILCIFVIVYAIELLASWIRRQII